jgi:hypothetical protein
MTGVPQAGHVNASDAPHSEQNLAPARFSAPHDVQVASAT